jgi:hypothetical protein
LARGGEKSVESLRQALHRKVIDLGKPGKDEVFGWGFVDRPPVCP